MWRARVASSRCKAFSTAPHAASQACSCESASPAPATSQRSISASSAATSARQGSVWLARSDWDSASFAAQALPYPSTATTKWNRAAAALEVLARTVGATARASLKRGWFMMLARICSSAAGSIVSLSTSVSCWTNVAEPLAHRARTVVVQSSVQEGTPSKRTSNAATVFLTKEDGLGMSCSSAKSSGPSAASAATALSRSLAAACLACSVSFFRVWCCFIASSLASIIILCTFACSMCLFISSSCSSASVWDSGTPSALRS
mmetsp:Transcript_64505/g.151962  ORF Transcript_64505/g.151962 Transcript_64505/m.151962 type:complete len:262 (-) Transcript_64505:3034-3819(-)